MITKAVTTYGLLACVFVASSNGQQPSDVEAELASVREGLARAYNGGDLDLLLSYCHIDVIAIWQNGDVAMGHQGVRDVVSQLTKADNRIIASYDADPQVDHRTFLGDQNQVVVSAGKLNDRYTLVRPQGSEVQLHSNWSATLAKFDDRWLVVSFHVSTNAFDNEVITLYTKLTRWTSITAAGAVGLAIGAIGATRLGRRKRKS